MRQAPGWRRRYGVLALALAVVPLGWSGLTGSLPPASAADAVISPAPAVDRHGGADRYATAAEVAGEWDSSPVVVLATGADFADALAGAAAAGFLRAPVLLTRPDALSPQAASSLERLHPSLVLALGGPGALSDPVLKAATAYAPVRRVAGATAVDTAVAVSRDVFPDGAPAVLVATRSTFPDALAAAAASTAAGGPLLLVPPTGLPDSVRAEIERLGAARIYVLGGPGAVPAATVDALSGLAPTTRVAGADRYGTADAVAAKFFPSADRALLATGRDWPDALAGAALASGVATEDPTVAPGGSTPTPTPTVTSTPTTTPTPTPTPSETTTPTDPAPTAATTAASTETTTSTGATTPTPSTGDGTGATTYDGEGLVITRADPAPGIPVLLAPGTSVTAGTWAQLVRLAPAKVTVLGGTAVVPARVTDLLAKGTRPTPPPPPAPSFASSISAIPDSVWRAMVAGHTWSPGCPVGRSSLRYLRVTHWGFDGKAHTGEIVVHRVAATDTVAVFRGLFEHRLPIRHMYLPEHYGPMPSGKGPGANDWKAMADDNTSGFNCRWVDGNPGVWSPHTYGTAIDINDVENPYQISAGWVEPPGSETYLDRSNVRPGMITPALVRAVFTPNHFVWGTRWRNPDFQHFDSTR